MILISADNISKTYRTFSVVGASAPRKVLDQVSLSINDGETVALLGRSGCGKSTLARLLCGLERLDSGAVSYRGTPIDKLGKGERLFRREVTLVFQDSLSAVNPRFDVRAAISEPLRHLTGLDASARDARVAELLDMVQLSADIADRLPSQVSGGQLQRICIARALAPKPKLIILDEAVSNLDIHLQASALALLSELQKKQGIAYLFVTHDLRLVERFADRVIVMEEGKIVEECATGEIERLSHPASRLLKDAVLPALPHKRSGCV
ncbi:MULTISPECIES: nickel import ATP-binding protein NikE [Agrobacterium]|uniref:nickel import ATP-binding protein NikE n=1 Tax=Agrobacterium TaxID=357 RepID=UPI0017FDB6D8|nr:MULTISPECIES: nickel import ATP-binding protein NikE [Agrobacterium]MBA4774987.1 nickel import ATP-binding protein NikE [Hyphomicrobiales bacterium]MCZ7858914.1 nickel import ATP-binding protein NikE [Agrobacterium salinitolerans]MDA5640079.1 nickel import ATP-binding protein NikE [Agrobacterium sp. ST15.13.013]MDA7000038.1 nickel import ATP-binding protein NikE [Agrobacterium salinitolerans]